MNSRSHSRADLHVHSKHSDRPSEWFLRRIGAPESFVEPADIYRRARERGMDFVTITDHNCIRGCLEIGHLPGTFPSAEVTTYFPEDGCKVHVLVLGVTEDQFRAIQELRASIYELQRYLVEEDIICSVSHPLFRVNDRLTVDQVEKLILLFKRFELLNGIRGDRAAELAGAILGGLDPQSIQRMAERHNIEPAGPEPWKKWFTGGSDDHSGAYCASAHTKTPYAENVEEFLAGLRRGDHEAAGSAGSSLVLGHCVYHVAHQYYNARFLGGSNGKPNLVGAMFEKLLAEPGQRPSSGLGQLVAGFATSLAKARQLRKLSEAERVIVDEFSALFSEEDTRDAASPPMSDRRTFRIACRISHTLGYSFLRRFEKYVREGRIVESLQSIASLGPVVFGLAPYLAAFSAQHKDEVFLQTLANHFPTAAHLKERGPGKAWVTDAFSDTSGVGRTTRALATLARKTGKPMTVITCQVEAPAIHADVKNFDPVGTFALPEFEQQDVCFPPFLEVIEYLERRRFNEVIISTPGPLGLAALAGARLLGLRTTGVYHTDFPRMIRHLTDDYSMEQLAWKFIQWFYEQMDVIAVPSSHVRHRLIDVGLDAARVSVMPRGVDGREFSPERRDPGFWSRFGLVEPFRFLCASRVTRKDNLVSLLEAFGELRKRGRAVDLVLLGDGPERARLEEQYRDPHIVFTGALGREQLAVAYASADALVLPSTLDAFGSVVLEAQACGLPVIVSDQGGPREIVEPSRSGLVIDSMNVEALVDAMDRLATDPALCHMLRQRALVNAAECSWDKVLDSFWNTAQHSLVRTRTMAASEGEPPFTRYELATP